MGTQMTDLASMGGGLPLMFDPDEQDAGARRRPGTAVAYETGTPADQADVQGISYGDNNEKLPKKLQIALQMLLTMYVNEGQIARREEVKKCLEAREFWKGLQYKYWSESGQWHLPFELKTNDSDEEDQPRYAFVTNYYQAFGLSIMAVLSQDVPRVRLWPQNPDDPEDVQTAEAGTSAVELIERNNRMSDLLVDEAFYLWTDGKIGGYVRYVVDGSRFGYSNDDQLGSGYQKMGEDAYQCPQCGAETPQSNYMGVCQQCGTPLDQSHYAPAPTAMVPQVQQTTKTPNGAEVVDIVGGLNLKTPPWARYQHEFPYLIWDQLSHRARLKAAFPWVAKKIGGAAIAPEDTQAQYERTSQLELISGGELEPIGATGDITANLVTWRQAWLRPWAYELLDDEEIVDALYETFPLGAYVGFAGDVYCCSRNESLDDHWRVMHALPGDGQSRPALGTSFISVQQRYNTLSNLVIETAEHAIPATWASPAVCDFDAIAESYAEPGAIYQSPAPAGTNISQGFFETTPAAVNQYVVNHMDTLVGQTGQFLTGAFPALFGGEMEGNDTASGYSMARDQAMGRIGLVWRRMKQFHADLMLLSVDVFRKNRPTDVQAPIYGRNGQAKSRTISLADLKGNCVAYPESDTQYPTLWSQQRATLMTLMQSEDPMIGKVLGDPENLGLIKRLIGLEEFQIPDDDARTKELEIIEELLQDAQNPAFAQFIQTGQSTHPVDQLLDNHDVAFETIFNWANTPQGIEAARTNPMGFANVHNRAQAHYSIMQSKQQQAKPPGESINFKDLPPDGKMQMALQAGLQLNPMGLMAQEQHQQEMDKAKASKPAAAAPGGN